MPNIPSPAQPGLFQSPPQDTRVRVGPAGWNYKDWVGIVYPANAGRSFDQLRFLSCYFDTVEINSTFYAPPRPETAAGWARRVRDNPRFRFTAKAWQRLTHERKEAAESGTLAADCDEVRRSLAPLVESGLLGALLVQFPWSFRYTTQNLDYVETVCRQLRGFPLVLEVRHGSWAQKALLPWLRERRVAFCNVDQPVIGESLRPAAIVTSGVGYLRLHGRNYDTWFDEDAGRDARYDYLYTKAEIGQLAGKVKEIMQEADQTYAITNNHFRGQALVNALDILEELDSRPPDFPPLLAEAYPERFKRKDPV
jgi:uncharacterized protein YecE (DUF72 family)